jgi:flagellin
LDVNTGEAQTGVHAEIDDNGELSLSSNSNISLQLGTTRTAMTAAHALGVGDLITDSAGGGPDGALDAASFTVGAGIKLTSINGTTISIDGNASAQTATGLLSQNTDLSSVATGSAISSISIATQAGAQAAIDPVDNALETINATRSEMGAVTNRLDFTISNLMNVSENTAAARSRIVDADFAAETANLSRAQVLQQASQAMLAQANAAPQRVLQLLNS